jgi:phosphoribosylglycinamide formyltransferase 1
VLEAREISLVCLAGFMRALSGWFVARWRDRVLNIHPSLLPAFPGLETHRKALAAGVRFAGCTVHFVRAEVDAGPIIVQGVVPVRIEDTVETLAARVLQAEHRCYPLALELVASGRAHVVDERVLIEGANPPGTTLINPAPN